MSTRQPDLILAQVYVLRAQLDVLVASLEGQITVPASAECRHPEEKRLDVSTMESGPMWKCAVCDQEFEGTV